MATPKDLVRVAVDIMGGDNAPEEIVRGALLAAAEDNGGLHIILVGDQDVLSEQKQKHDMTGLPISMIPSEGVVIEGEPPALALRQKPKASIMVSTGLVKAGHADASVTMGSTGAAMASSAVILGRIPGIERPSLGGPIIGSSPHTFIADLGTNVDCRPSQLLSFAAMGVVFARQFWNVEKPRVAILSVGSEQGKGNSLVQETDELMKTSGLNYIGNVEANDLVNGKAEVVVCDGFVGNVIMKLSEGLGESVSDFLKGKLAQYTDVKEAQEISKEVYDLYNVVETHGGGPILGVDGISVVGHGSARAGSVKRAIGTAQFAVTSEFIARLNDELARVLSNAKV